MSEAEVMRLAPEVAILRRLSREMDALYGFTGEPGEIGDPVVRPAPDAAGSQAAATLRAPPGGGLPGR